MKHNSNPIQSGSPPLAREIDFQQTERFLKSVDPTATKWTFQTFDDNADRKSGSLAAIYNGTLSECWNALKEKSQSGAGVFFTVNRTNLEGRSLDNIIGVRYLWRENDHEGLPPLPLDPHIINESSPGKFHEYIAVKNAPLDEFNAVQQRIVDEWGSDPNAKDITRVLRLPGFPHQKVNGKKGLTGEHFIVRTVHESGAAPLDWEEVKKIFPPVAVVDISKSTNRLNVPKIDSNGTILKIAEVISAMRAISPDCNYKEWLTTGMALHHETRGGKEGLDIWESWSVLGKGYCEGECSYRWSTFGKYQGPKVTIKSLFKMAYRHGWSGKIPQTKDGFEWANEQHKRQLAHFNTLHGCVMVECKSVVMYREYDQNIKAMVTRAVGSNAMKEYLNPYQIPQGKEVDTTDGTRYLIVWKPIFPQWLYMCGRRTYSQVVFKPEGGMLSGDLILPDSKYLNLYQGLALKPVEGDCTLIVQHIWEVIADENMEIFMFLLSWLAHMVQFPGQHAHLMVVLRSGQGTGKNMLTDILIDIFGDHAAFCTRPDDVTGRFTDHLATSVCVILNEAVWGGDKKHEGVLKSLITDDWIPLEKKFLPKFRVPNCTHIIVLTNNDWAVPVGVDDRRTVLLDVSERHKGNKEYFNRLAACISNGGSEAFLHILMTFDLSSFNPREMPEHVSASKIDHKVRSMDSVTAFWFDCLDSGQILYTDRNSDDRNLTCNWESESVWIETQVLYKAYRQWADGCGYGRERVAQVSMITKLKKLSGMKKKRSSDMGRKNGYQFYPLDACKMEMESVLKHRVDEWWS